MSLNLIPSRHPKYLADSTTRLDFEDYVETGAALCLVLFSLLAIVIATVALCVTINFGFTMLLAAPLMFGSSSLVALLPFMMLAEALDHHDFKPAAQRLMSRVDKAHGWQPRQGAQHPEGRVETHDRFVIDRSIDNKGMIEIGLKAWTYDGTWQPSDKALVTARCFDPDDLQAIEDWEKDLRDKAVLECDDKALELCEIQNRIERSQQLIAITGHRELV